MPSFKASDELTSKPAWLSAADQLTCFGADAAETGLSGLVMHQGWTIPAGGNGNPFAQRETIACVNMTSDIDSDTDFSAEIAGGPGVLESGDILQWTDRPSTSYGLNQWGFLQSPEPPGLWAYMQNYWMGSHGTELIFSGSDWFETTDGSDMTIPGNEATIWDQFDLTLAYRISLMVSGGPWPNGMPFKMKLSGMNDGNYHMQQAGYYSATDITINCMMTDYTVGAWGGMYGHTSPSFQFYQDTAADTAEGAVITGQTDYHAYLLSDLSEANYYFQSRWPWQIIMP
jgi:hypothetical protein